MHRIQPVQGVTGSPLEDDILSGNIDNFMQEYLRSADNHVKQHRDELIDVLRRYPHKIGTKNLAGNTLLHLAFLNIAPNLAQSLLDLDLNYTNQAGVDLLINVRNQAGQTVVDIAKQNGNQKLLNLISEYIQKYCSKCMEEGDIHNFIKIYSQLRNDADLAKEMREQAITFLRAHPEMRHAKNADGNTLLHLSLQYKCPMLTQALLDLDLEFIGEESELLVNTKNKAGQTPLAQALGAKDADAVKTLVAHNASFYLERDAEGTYLTSQYSLSNYLGDLLPLGQSLRPERLDKVLTIVRAKIGTITDPFELREYLDRVAIRLLGLTGDGRDIDFKQWAKLYANSVSKISDLCTIESCFKFGEDFGESVNYLLIHVRALLELVITGDRNPELERELLLAVNTAKVDQETTLLNLLRQNNETMIGYHVNGLYARLLNHPYLCYPAGWPGSTGVPGHAVYVDLNLTKVIGLTCLIGAFNLGGGLGKDYNAKLMVTDNIAVPALGAIKADEASIKSYLHNLVWANLNGTNEQQIDLALNMIYDPNIFGRPVKTLAKPNQAEIIQPIGNCIVKNFLFAMRSRLGATLYRSVYLQILNVMFEQIQSYCGQLPKPQEVAQALRASEVVFNDITVMGIQYMHVFQRTSPVCKLDKHKERKEGEEHKKDKKFNHRGTPVEIIDRMGLLSVSPKSVVYHRGELLMSDEKKVVPKSRGFI